MFRLKRAEARERERYNTSSGSPRYYFLLIIVDSYILINQSGFSAIINFRCINSDTANWGLRARSFNIPHLTTQSNSNENMSPCCIGCLFVSRGSDRVWLAQTQQCISSILSLLCVAPSYLRCVQFGGFMMCVGPSMDTITGTVHCPPPPPPILIYLFYLLIVNCLLDSPGMCLSAIGG